MLSKIILSASKQFESGLKLIFKLLEHTFECTYILKTKIRDEVICILLSWPQGHTAESGENDNEPESPVK